MAPGFCLSIDETNVNNHKTWQKVKEKQWDVESKGNFDLTTYLQFKMVVQNEYSQF